MEVKINELTPELFLYLYTSVDWEPPENKTGERSTKKYNGCIVAYEITLRLEW
mgnify:CR=1 FL=1